MDDLAQLYNDGGDFLRRIPQPEEIDFDRIPGYYPPSKDKTLLNFAEKAGVKYIMSTSTISSALSKQKTKKKKDLPFL